MQDACEGKDLERVRAAVANIRDATRAASLSPDARRARALRGLTLFAVILFLHAADLKTG